MFGALWGSGKDPSVFRIWIRFTLFRREHKTVREAFVEHCCGVAALLSAVCLARFDQPKR